MFSSGPGRREERSRLRRQSSADQVAARIRRAIITGELRPGERLRQDDIADEFGVSRIPVREALIALDGEGWVRLESNRGARVTGLEKRDIADHYELRGLVFGLVASRAAELAKPDDCKELTRLLRALGEANDLILRFLVKLTGSARLRAALRVTPSIIPENFFEIVPGAREVQAAGLASVIRAIKAGDPDRADRGMRSTLRRLGEAVAQAFTANGLLTGG
jgi:DNA-binding GntR family transcriptional regulator